jgi:hypothetical protein
MADTIAVVEPDEALTVAVSEGTYILNTQTDLSNQQAVVESMSNVADVDITTNGLDSGSILVYKTTTNKWTSTRLLNEQNMDAGEF